MIYSHTHPNKKKSSTIYTPPQVSKTLYDIVTLQETLHFPTVLDPSIGTGNLSRPYSLDSEIIGCDITRRPMCVDVFRRGDFTSFKRWHVVPDLIVCNPPFNGGDRRMMWPERFLRQIVNLFGPSVPILIIVPVGFRFNQRWKSSRRHFLKFECPKITTIISLPLDVFNGVEVFSEVLVFNLPVLDPHYWI